ncbi:hypothetical protein BC937DRAFT_86444 [Endogone sp. FLAS-F59071]|nr:hypothetical protein BC937DRAFT_86444 [Endogone sp. FLAS-F59071]|eukprot:RUS13041.1 hypothetical protein BC937DRAFT_86444 [Endogone sp. FLAS-F59071]
MSTTDNGENDSPKFRPFVTPKHKLPKVKKAKYSTSLDPRGYIPVYEYVINGQAIMWDRETGYVHFTGIWKALGNSKAEIVKMVDSNPNIKVRKIRGGFLKIQGTWIPYEHAHILCSRTAWAIRKELIPLFGPSFPLVALNPSHGDFNILTITPDTPLLSKSDTRYHEVAHSHPTHVHVPSRRPETMVSEMRKEPEDINDRIVASMSLSRLLNDPTPDESDHRLHTGQGWDPDTSMHDAYSDRSPPPDEFSHDSPDSSSDETATPTASDSSVTTPSPTFRVVPRFPLPYTNDDPGYVGYHPYAPKDHHHRPNPPKRKYSLQHGEPHQSQHQQPQVSVSYPQYRSSHASFVQPPPDLVAAINATISLQRLSQDDGARPLRPLERDALPSHLVVGEYTILFD